MNNRYWILIFLFLVHSLDGVCDIKLPKLISDGAILQRDVDLNIWGWGEPGEKVELSFDNQDFKSVTDQLGKWKMQLPAQLAGGPHQLIFKGSNEIILNDILFGDLWVCSGQSNMELPMRRLKDHYPEEVKNCNYPQIRQFIVQDKYDFKVEHDDFQQGIWKSAVPDNIMEFSGVAYFFAKDLYQKYRVPIGLINSALGGSPVEAWMSEDALKNFPYAYDELQVYKQEGYIERIEQKDKTRQQDWYAKVNADDKGNVKGSEWFLDTTDDSTWSVMEVPNFWSDSELGSVNGVVWFRKKVSVPKSMENQEVKLWLGRIVDQDHVYVNGQFIGSTGYQYPPRKYTVPAGVLKEGENTITIRVINEIGSGGFIQNKPYFLAVDRDTVDLKGDWKYQLGTAMPLLTGPTFVRWKPGGLYNKMISPLTKHKIKGVIWYQGESNTSDPSNYNETFSMMIDDWRTKWGQDDFPFIYVQLANFMAETNEPTESNWAELRQAQLETLSTPNTGMAVIVDLGEANDIHPLNKQGVGSRLAQEAFKLAYNEKGTSTCPIPTKVEFIKNKVVVSFTEQELKSIDNKGLRLFEISSDGKRFIKAKAKIKRNKVEVWANTISNPVDVRYAWSNNPVKANLYSEDELPCSPFEVRK
ncbi:MAG: beta galactosidase jelly roll domain-containing protein [Reichenbachiella sp.]